MSTHDLVIQSKWLTSKKNLYAKYKCKEFRIIEYCAIVGDAVMSGQYRADLKTRMVCSIGSSDDPTSLYR